jgi:hypothetical protein
VTLVNRKSPLWNYISDHVKGLLVDGEYLVEHASENPKNISDYSYLVFPFSKAYEGFLKKLFLDLDMIKEDAYYGDEIRIGRILNPHFIHEHENVFKKLVADDKNENDFVERMWKIWQNGRNKVFHYFPHNFRKLSLKEAKELIEEILDVMNTAVENCYVDTDLK